MKTTKKGFTLIELIVVIAIIGVLAAILVPSMLGYVKKSKVSSANSAANSLQKAINTALVEVDEESQAAGNIEKVSSDGSKVTITAVAGSDVSKISDADFKTKVDNYMEKAKSKKWAAQCEGGVCLACAIAVDNTYTGTAPGGVITVDNYTKYSSQKVDDALEAAVKKVS